MGYDTTTQDNPFNSTQDYWATEDINLIGQALKEKIDGYYLFVRGFGRLQLWHRSYDAYYNNVMKGGQLYQNGVAGEFTILNCNHYASILQAIKSLVTQSRPSFEPIGINSDSETTSQVILAKGLLEYYMRIKGLETYISQAVLDALIFGEGYIRVGWDASSGKIYGVSEEGTPVNEGDLEFENYTPLDVIRDYSKMSPHHHDWYILRTFRNKYTLAARFPNLKDMILASPSRQNMQKDLLFTMPMLFKDTDDIIVYEFYHKPTAALPKGRLTWVNDNGEVIMDGNLPYKDIPIYSCFNEVQSQTPFGKTVGFDLLPYQENLDNMSSTIATNQNAFGVQNIVVEQGSGFAAPDLYGSVKLLTIPQGAQMPKVLELLSTPGEIFNFRTQMITEMESLSAINAMMRGAPMPAGMSGAALAMYQSQAIEFNMPMQLSYTRLVEHLGGAIVDILQDYAVAPRIAEIAGKSKRPMVQEFTSKDIERISRVQVNMGNPANQTIAGRLNTATMLLQNKLVDDPNQVITLINTGEYEPLTYGRQSQLILIQSENEDMMDSKPCPVLFTDNHAQHVIEHSPIMDSPEARRNPQLFKNFQDHIQQHMDFLKNPQYQEFFALTNQQPYTQPTPAQPNAQPAPGTAGKPIQPPMANHPIVGAAGGPPQPAANSAPGQVNGVNLPSGPRNPLTGVKTMLPAGAGRNSALSGKTK